MHGKIFRCETGPNKSTMAGYVNYGDDKTYLFNFRMTRVQLEDDNDKISKEGKGYHVQSPLIVSFLEIQVCNLLLCVGLRGFRV